MKMTRHEGVLFCQTVLSSTDETVRFLAKMAMDLVAEVQAQEKHIITLEQQKTSKHGYNAYMRQYMQQYRLRKKQKNAV